MLWIGTGSGLNRLDLSTQSFSHYRQKEGLISDTVISVVGDNDGKLWLGLAEKSLAVFDPKTKEIKNNIGAVAHCSALFGAHFKASDGQLLFGNKGYCAFYPDQVFTPSQPPKVVFSDFRLLNKKVAVSTKLRPSILTRTIDYTRSLTLTHKDNVLSFEFSALHFANPQRNQYQYKLQGFNPNWIATGADNRRATYTNLSPGRYIFKVKASNHEGVWSTQEREIRLNILPAPWFSWWAYTLYFLLLGSVLLIFVYLSFKKLAAERKTAATIVASEQQLSLALWGSGDQLWDWDQKLGLMQRKNILSHFIFKAKQVQREMYESVELLHPDDKANFLQAFNAHVAGEVDYFECVYRIKDKQGSWRWVKDRGKIVETDEHGAVLRISGTLQDVHSLYMTKEALRELNETLEQKVIKRTEDLQTTISQLKTAQQQLVEAEKMAALGNLVAGVAHEVNTPLGNCITMVSMHLEKLTALGNQMAEGNLSRRTLIEYVENTQQSQQLVASNLERTAQLVQRFKSIAVDQSIESLREVVFIDYLTNIIETIEAQPKDKQVAIKLNCEGRWKIKTYPGIWWQILSILIENSLLHGFFERSNGEITISSRLEKQRILLTYADDGNGLTATTLEKIYEPFYTTARGRGGKGLGMYIVFNLVVQKLGGTISCQSETNRGVLFTISAPIKNLN